MKFNKWTVALAAAGLVSIGHNAQAEEGYISALSNHSQRVCGYIPLVV